MKKNYSSPGLELFCFEKLQIFLSTGDSTNKTSLDLNNSFDSAGASSQYSQKSSSIWGSMKEDE